MVPDYGTKYEENTSNHHGGMCDDGLMDWTCSYIPGFCYSGVGNNK